MQGAFSSKSFALASLVVLCAIWLGIRPALASAELVPRVPKELEALEEALDSIAEAAEASGFRVAEESVKKSAAAWARFRDGGFGDRVSPFLIWHLDALEAYLRHAVSAKNAPRLLRGSLLGKRLCILLRRHFRSDGALTLRKLQTELREIYLLSKGANLANLRQAERARKRALFLWERLRAPAERRFRRASSRMRYLGSYFDTCFDELALASRGRDLPRLRRAARSALDLVETMSPLLNRRE